jgi:predicted ester cyclase
VSGQSEIECFRNAVPDLTHTVGEQVAEGDKVVTRYTASGTHQGEFFVFLARAVA